MRSLIKRLMILLAAILGGAGGASAQVPGPVDLPIQNLPQETPLWCWVAVAQQIILASAGPAGTPAQCALVALAYGQPPQACCSGDPRCVTTGSLSQVQALIARFGGHLSSIAPPTDPMTLYNALAGGHPIILEVQTGPMSTHVVVLRGMFFTATPYGYQPVLIINDPMSYFTQPVPFESLRPMWRDAIVVH